MEVIVVCINKISPHHTPQYNVVVCVTAKRIYFTVYIPFRFAEEPQIQCQSDTALYCSMCLSIETEIYWLRV